jgi:hypothetical protein
LRGSHSVANVRGGGGNVLVLGGRFEFSKHSFDLDDEDQLAGATNIVARRKLREAMTKREMQGMVRCLRTCFSDLPVAATLKSAGLVSTWGGAWDAAANAGGKACAGADTIAET